MAPSDIRHHLLTVFGAAVDAVAAGPALTAALERAGVSTQRRVWILSMGKAAQPMAEAAVEALRRKGARPAGGIVIPPTASLPPHSALSVTVGNHPIPGQRSNFAAARLGEIVTRILPEDEVWVLLSGGTTSLVAAPELGVRNDELVELFDLLLSSGRDVAFMNRVRKRFLKWGAGRLAAALEPARVRNFIVSDVIGDDLNVIGSGPCMPDDSTAGEVRSMLVEAKLWARVPMGVKRYLAAAERDKTLETPKPGAPAFYKVEKRVVASNRMALEAAATKAFAIGYEPRIMTTPISGEAADYGRQIASALIAFRAAGAATGRLATPIRTASVTPRVSAAIAQATGGEPRRAGPLGTCFIWGGEPTVTLGDAPIGRGGRCQELALAAARELGAAGDAANGVVLLAGGTDGRDGTSDVAGAVVDGSTWKAVEGTSRDPERHLREHDSYHALAAAGALFRTGLTYTNVMDVVIGVCASGGIPD